MRVTFGMDYGSGIRMVYVDDHLIGFSKAKHGIVAFRELNSQEWKRFVGVGELRRYVLQAWWSFV